MDEPIHILIGTPCHEQKVTVAYLKTVFALQAACQDRKLPIRFSLEITKTAFVDMARNYFATLVLENTSYTHLLFVDADQGFEPDLLFDMLRFDKPVTSAIMLQRELNFEQLWAKARTLETSEKLQSLGSSYTLPELLRNEAGQIEIRDGFVRVGSAATGIMLIKRAVIERMAELPDLFGTHFKPLIEEGYSGRILQCFRPYILENNLPLGEDLSFCRRWIQECGGEIWSNVTHETKHVGPFTFKGRFIDRFLQQGAVRPAKSEPSPA